MVIADEVLMGLRLGCGVSCYSVGLEPDLVTLGKAIGSGLPVAAVLGTADAFRAVEDGRAPRAGTYHGNPLVTAAVKATIDVLKTKDYAAFLARGDRLRRSIEAAMGQIGPACTSGYGSVFSLWFSAQPPKTYDEAKAALRPTCQPGCIWNCVAKASSPSPAAGDGSSCPLPTATMIWPRQGGPSSAPPDASEMMGTAAETVWAA